VIVKGIEERKEAKLKQEADEVAAREQEAEAVRKEATRQTDALRAEATRLESESIAQAAAIEKARLAAEARAAREAEIQAKKQAAAAAKAARLKSQDALFAERAARARGLPYGRAVHKPHVVPPPPEMVQAIEPESNKEPVDLLLGSKGAAAVEAHDAEVSVEKNPAASEVIEKISVEAK
jgi:hypothetical protein